jgi:hypothetical protein
MTQPEYSLVPEWARPLDPDAGFLTGLERGYRNVKDAEGKGLTIARHVVNQWKLRKEEAEAWVAAASENYAAASRPAWPPDQAAPRMPTPSQVGYAKAMAEAAHRHRRRLSVHADQACEAARAAGWTDRNANEAALRAVHAADLAAPHAAQARVSARRIEAAAVAAGVRAEAARRGLVLTGKLTHDFNPHTGKQDGKFRDATVTVEGTFMPGDRRALAAAKAGASTVLGMVPAAGPSRVWGTDPATALSTGRVRINKSGAESSVARHLAGRADGPFTPGGNAMIRSAAAAAVLAAAGFPLRRDADGAEAREPASPRPGQQVPPRTRGRHQ